MELIKRETPWFLSSAGCNAFASTKTLEDRSVFLYSYLKQIAPEKFDEDQTLFRTAFFLADAVMDSPLPYSTYPALIDPQKNPFVAYLANVNQYPGAQTVYYVFLSILHGLAMPIRQNDWVYEKRICRKNLQTLENVFVPARWAWPMPMHLLSKRLCNRCS